MPDADRRDTPGLPLQPAGSSIANTRIALLQTALDDARVDILVHDGRGRDEGKV